MTISVMATSTIEQEVLRKNDPFGEPVLVALRGSHSHGLYIPPEEEHGTDDIDIMNIVVPGLDTYFGLSEYGRRGSKDYWEGEYDVCSYTLEKFIRLLLKSNPNVISIQ
jgi:predicted nucleotidyltransferase